MTDDRLQELRDWCFVAVPADVWQAKLVAELLAERDAFYDALKVATNLNAALAERCAQQSELLSKKAEVVT